MSFITSVEELVHYLKTTPPKHYPKVIKKIKIAHQQFMPFASWNQDRYTRNCISRSENYELVLLCWNEGDQTPIHNHSGQKCWVYQIDGTVSEIRYEKDAADQLNISSKLLLHPGKLTYMEDRMGYHSLKNETGDRAMTLHLYVEPINACDVYNEEKAVFESKVLSYDSHLVLTEEEAI